MDNKPIEQWFQPGDKVMRVTGNRPDGFILKAPVDPPEYGKVYCVADFYEGPLFNAVILVGGCDWHYHFGRKVGWPASAFRKVDEIRRCVDALSHSEEVNMKPQMNTDERRSEGLNHG